MATYDHFHASYLEDVDQSGEIEGGWTGYPNGFNDMTKEQQESWWYEKCVSWGMPRGAEIVHIWLAG